MTSEKQIMLVEEEYGYRTWVGTLTSEVNKEHIITWWLGLTSVLPMFFNPSKSFPIPLHELKKDSDGFYWVQNNEKCYLKQSKVVLHAHVHEDEDSYLKNVSDSQYHYHKGYNEDLDESLDEKKPTVPDTPENKSIFSLDIEDLVK